MILTVLLTLFCTVYCNNDISSEESFKVFFNNNTTRNRFASLLKSVAKLNENRYNVLHKWHSLQDDMPSDSLRSKHFWHRYETKPKQHVILIIIVPNNNNSSNNTLVFNSNGNLNKQTDEIPHKYYRRKWHKACQKKASKMCAKSCKDAFSRLCKRFKCTSKAKKAIKKHCKSSCQKDFSSSRKYSDSSSDSSDSSDSDCS